MAMKPGLLCHERNFPDINSDVFTCFLEKYPTIKTLRKYQIVFCSDYSTSSVQEPNTYDNCMHTYFINTIYPISYSNDGSNGIVDVCRTFKGRDISWVAVDLNEPMKTGDIWTKIKEVPYRKIDTTVSVTAPWSAPDYTATCVDGEVKVNI